MPIKIMLVVQDLVTVLWMWKLLGSLKMWSNLLKENNFQPSLYLSTESLQSLPVFSMSLGHTANKY